MDKTDIFIVRSYRDEDKNFIYASWLRGLYYGDSWFSEIPKNIFMETYHGVLDHLMQRKDLVIRVACLKEDSDVILGYAVSHTLNQYTILDFIFVKSAWRRIGVGKSLLPDEVHAVTHLTKLGRSLKPKNVIFNPFAL